MRKFDDPVQQQPSRACHQGGDEAGHYQQVWDVVRLSVFDFPSADKQVKSQIVDPSGQEQLRQERASLEALLERSDPAPAELGAAYGRMGQLYYLGGPHPALSVIWAALAGGRLLVSVLLLKIKAQWIWLTLPMLGCREFENG